MALVNKGAAELIEESDLSGETLISTVDTMLGNPEKLRQTGENCKKMAITDANERIYSVVKKVLKLV